MPLGLNFKFPQKMYAHLIISYQEKRVHKKIQYHLFFVEHKSDTIPFVQKYSVAFENGGIFEGNSIHFSLDTKLEKPHGS